MVHLCAISRMVGGHLFSDFGAAGLWNDRDRVRLLLYRGNAGLCRLGRLMKPPRLSTNGECVGLSDSELCRGCG